MNNSFRRFRIEKLVRDGTPQELHRHGIESEIMTVSGEELMENLLVKLDEEVEEAKAAYWHHRKSALPEDGITPKGLAEELADCLEVMMTIAKMAHITWGHVEEERKKKAEKKGSFLKGVYMEWMEMEASNPLVNKYAGNARYPEIFEDFRDDPAHMTHEQKMHHVRTHREHVEHPSAPKHHTPAHKSMESKSHHETHHHEEHHAKPTHKEHHTNTHKTEHHHTEHTKKEHREHHEEHKTANKHHEEHKHKEAHPHKEHKTSEHKEHHTTTHKHKDEK